MAQLNRYLDRENDFPVCYCNYQLRWKSNRLNMESKIVFYLSLAGRQQCDTIWRNFVVLAEF